MNIGGRVKIESRVFSRLWIDGQCNFHWLDWLRYFFAGHIFFQQVLFSSKWFSSGRSFVSRKEKIARFFIVGYLATVIAWAFSTVFLRGRSWWWWRRNLLRFFFFWVLFMRQLGSQCFGLFVKLWLSILINKSNDHVVSLQLSFYHLECIWFQVRIEA